MNFFRKLPRLPRASGTRPGPVSPGSWNALVDAVHELEQRITGLIPGDSADIGYRRSTQGGFTAWIKRRSNGGSSVAPKPWQPSFFKDGDVFKCRFNLGSVNQVIAGNWNDSFELPSDDTLKFAVLTIVTESGKVTGVTISVDTAAPTEDYIAKDIPPTEFKIVLGAVGSQSAKMIVTTNLSMVATEVFRETKTVPAVGGESFSRWWRWTEN